MRERIGDAREASGPQGTIFEEGRFRYPTIDWRVAVAEIWRGNESAADADRSFASRTAIPATPREKPLAQGRGREDRDSGPP